MAKGKKKKSAVESTEAYHAFVDFSRDISDKISEMTKEGANEYKELYKVWSEYAQKMTDQMAAFSPEDEGTSQEMQKVWENYSELMSDQFYEIMNKDNGPYKELYQMWTDYSKHMGEHLSEIMSEGIREQHDLYELWMDSFGIKDKEHEEDFTRYYRDMNQFWQDTWMKSRGIFSPVPDNDMDFNTQLKELNSLWTNAYSKMMMNLVRSPEFAKMDGNILSSNLDMIKANDILMNQSLNAMGLPTKENLNDIYHKLHDMDRKISEIARAVNSKNKR